MTFENSLKQFSDKYKIGDTISSHNFFILDLNSILDTTIALKLGLLDTTGGYQNYVRLQKEYRCSLVGTFKINSFLVVMTAMYTTGAGDGNPEIKFTTFDEAGYAQDKLIISLQGIHDPWEQSETRIVITKDFQFNIIDINNSYDIVNDERVLLKSSTQRHQKYIIDNNGHFKLN